jgi:hypothetical protein
LGKQVLWFLLIFGDLSRVLARLRSASLFHFCVILNKLKKIRSPSLFHLPVHSRCRGFLLFTWSHSDTPQLVGLLWTRDRPVAETSTWQHKHSQVTNIHAPRGIRTHDPSNRLAADLRLRTRGHWDRQLEKNGK